MDSATGAVVPVNNGVNGPASADSSIDQQDPIVCVLLHAIAGVGRHQLKGLCARSGCRDTG
jgi:hypothetical protein